MTVGRLARDSSQCPGRSFSHLLNNVRPVTVGRLSSDSSPCPGRSVSSPHRVRLETIGQKISSSNLSTDIHLVDVRLVAVGRSTSRSSSCDGSLLRPTGNSWSHCQYSSSCTGLILFDSSLPPQGVCSAAHSSTGVPTCLHHSSRPKGV